MSSNGESFRVPGLGPIRPEPPPEQPDIFDFNAHNRHFVAGYSVIRVEQAKLLTNERDKTQLVNSVVDDLVASISLINNYHQVGILSDNNIFELSTMLQNIEHNNTNVQARWDEKIASLRQERRQLRHEYRDLVKQMDTLGQRYAAKVKALEGQVAGLKKQLTWVEAGGSLCQSQSCLNDHVNRRCVSEDPSRRGGQVKQEEMIHVDQVDGEWQDESTHGDAKE